MRPRSTTGESKDLSNHCSSGRALNDKALLSVNFPLCSKIAVERSVDVRFSKIFSSRVSSVVFSE